MRNIYFILIGLMTTMFFSCNKEETKSLVDPGSLSVDIGLEIKVIEENSGLKSTPSLEDFKVIIYFEGGNEAMVFETISTMPDTIFLEPGIYYLTAFSDNNIPAAFENPYYYGISETFTINSGMQQSVQVNCKLANTLVSVVYSEDIINSFTDYSSCVSTALDSIIFSKDENRIAYFETLPLDIRVDLFFLNPDGTELNKTLTGSIANPLPGSHYEILVNASLENGQVAFEVFMDSTEIPLEIIEINDQTEIIVNPNPSELEFGDLLITEIMMDPSSLSDTEGEWFEIYNNTDHDINLQNLVLIRETTNNHIISDSILLLPGEYIALSRTEAATDASPKYIYGSAISLPNTGAVLSIFNADTDTGPGSLIFSVDYGSENFPGSTGASISLNPNRLNADDAILGISWCVSDSMYNTGDLGTPGSVNDSCQ